MEHFAVHNTSAEGILAAAKLGDRLPEDSVSPDSVATADALPVLEPVLELLPLLPPPHAPSMRTTIASMLPLCCSAATAAPLVPMSRSRTPK